MQLPFQRIAIGLAMPGDFDSMKPNFTPEDRLPTLMGEFARKKDALALAASFAGHSTSVRGYLYGRRDRGWVVIVPTTKAQRDSYHYCRCWKTALAKQPLAATA